MESFMLMMSEIFRFMYLEITVYGFTFTFMEIVLFQAVAFIAIKLAMFIFRENE